MRLLAIDFTKGLRKTIEAIDRQGAASYLLSLHYNGGKVTAVFRVPTRLYPTDGKFETFVKNMQGVLI